MIASERIKHFHARLTIRAVHDFEWLPVILQVSAIEFVALAIEYVKLAQESVTIKLSLRKQLLIMK